MDKIFFEIHSDLPREGPGRDEYTRKAFKMLPCIKKPEMLDIGCGTGPQTMELARWTNGQIVAIDTHQPYINELNDKIKKSNLTDRVKAINCSMFEMNFPDEYFDIIWSEGAIYITGFEKGLKEWKKFIKSKGFLVVHEVAWLKSHPPDKIRSYWKKMYPAITTIARNLAIIDKCGYRTIGHFSLPEDAWWDLYYNPLQKRVKLLKKKYKDNKKALKILNEETTEIDMYRKYYKWYGSVFFIMQKIGKR